MPVFLTPEWARAFADLLNGSEEFRRSAEHVRICIAQHVTGAPDGDVDYYIRVTEGAVDIDFGTPEDADVEILQDYATAVAIARGDLGMQNAFMQGRVKVTGDLTKLMENQGALAGLEGLRPGFDVDYR